MSHVAVVFDARGLDDPQSLFARIESAYPADQNLRIIKRSDTGFANLTILRPHSLSTEQYLNEGDPFVSIDGSLYDNRPVPELLRILSSSNPLELRTLNGHFNAIVYCKARKALTVITHRLGYRPLYYWCAGTRHVVSSEIRAIRAVAGRAFDLDPIGLIELFAFGHNVGNRTLLSGISVLPPGSVITFDESGIRCVEYYKLTYANSAPRMSTGEYGESIASCLKTVVPKYASSASRTSIFLSGGLDSRIVAGALGDAANSVRAYTFGHPESRDVRFARDLAARIGMSHSVLNYPNNYLSMAIEEVVTRTECASPFFHTTSVIFHDRISLDTDSILVGFCGDALSGRHLNRALLKASTQRQIIQQIFNRALCVSVKKLALIFLPQFLDRNMPDVLDAFRASVTSIEESRGADVADVWDMRQRQRRFTFASPKVDRPRFEVFAPLLDNEFVDLMTCLPVEARWRQSAYRQAIVNGFPQLRDVPWTRTGRRVPGGPTEYRIEEARRIAGKAYFIALRRTGLTRGIHRDTYKSTADDMRSDENLFRNYLPDRVALESMAPGVFNAQGINTLAERHMLGGDFSHLLGTILSVAVYLNS